MYELDSIALVRDLLINLVGLTLLVYVGYYRRHRRRDFVTGYVAVNLSLFVVAASLAATSALTVGVGFGLFAVLSIVRLRSEEGSQAEVGYTMVVLVLGLVCGLPDIRPAHTAIFATILVAGMLIADHPRLTGSVRHHQSSIVLDRVLTNGDLLRVALAEQLGGDIVHSVVREIDLVRETMTIDVTWSATTTRDGVPR